jgi:outer membrane cobalamin receptor
LPVIAGLFVTSQAAHAAGIEELQQLSLEELSEIAVTSVSKSAEPLRRAPATVYVITQADIVRSGATSIPEILRLAPNLRLTQLTSSSYSVSARGFGGNSAAQNFSNKILMLIDGRSVYSPLYSGIYLDAQDVNIADIDRIEVIGGAGATLWGANAMNGVINIITRTAYQTSGTVIAAAAGTDEKDISARYGQTGLLGTAQAGDDPTHQALLKSSFDWGTAMTLDATLRYVGRLPNPGLASYVELNSRFGWRVSKAVDISITGTNLLHARHLEYPAPYGEEVARTVYAEARWTF